LKQILRRAEEVDNHDDGRAKCTDHVNIEDGGDSLLNFEK